MHTSEKIFRTVLAGLREYFRIETHGIEHIPKRGRAIIAPNHSGCTGLDALMLTYTLHESLPRIPRVLAMWGVFKVFPWFAPMAQRLGLRPASISTGLALLNKGNLLVCFPEGERGSFKPTAHRYRLQRFKTGMIRMALTTGAPIVPCLIIGAEETTITLTTIQFGEGTLVPIPALLPPLPAKWDIHFFAPVDLSAYRQYADDKAKLRELADMIRARMQQELDHELSKRSYVYVSPGA